MILRSEIVTQVVDRDRRVRVQKDIVMTPGEPLGMVRKRLAESGPEGPRGTVLLLHGFAQNRYTWHTTKRSFSAFLAAEGYDVFTAEYRGHGRSRRYSATKPRTVDEYVQEDVPSLAREAMRLSGTDRIFLVGHSMGGMISYAAGATKLRDHVRGIVTIGSPYSFGLGNTLLRTGARALQLVRFTGIFDQNPLVPLKLLGGTLDKGRFALESRAWPKSLQVWRPGSIEKDILREFLSHSFESTAIQVAIDIIRGGGRQTLTEGTGRLDYGIAFEALDRPLLVLAGTVDSLAPPNSVRAAYDRSRSRDKTYRAFPNGHMDLILGREAASTTWPTIRDFLHRR